MFRPDMPDFYPKNENDQPDFGSILLTIDSNLIRTDDPHVVQKFVLSTQSPAASLMALLTYYGEPEQITSGRAVELLQESGRSANPVFVYVTTRPGIVEVLCSTQTHDLLVESPAFGNGSLLLMGEKLTAVVATVVNDLCRAAQSNDIPRLLCLDLSPATQEEQEEPPVFDADRVKAPEVMGGEQA